ASNAPTSSMNADLQAVGMDAVDGPAHVAEAADFVLDADAVLPADHLRDEQRVTPLHQFLVERHPHRVVEVLEAAVFGYRMRMGDGGNDLDPLPHELAGK